MYKADKIFKYLKRELGEKEFVKLKMKFTKKRKEAISKVIKESSEIRMLSKRLNIDVGELINKFKKGDILNEKQLKHMI